MKDCIFCKIIKGEIPGKFFYKDKDLVVFHDISPKAPVHVLLVPVKHIESLQYITREDEKLIGKVMAKIPEIARKLGIDDGFKIAVNNGRIAGQIVFHLHIHILGGWKRSPEWEI
ncbi:histidine triad nucleotide-binding protein [Candidatus Gottesmanbacteria bacterium RIFCSPHIGHO2_01_FULL_39_10]|uniref:Histidine triad nucleotide-binding protein n=1 Tax=Candidatus Gottesmanbacteria bacterium RIFCSPHIGHO2_01_FULL_39_10 TaxID=1798375 RepID=A0A1F5ZR72_9BACT|nr:MAG: histidine triad nucleotide-binding protein [Candidatus Gottesmanbacteria bacterium RIFCSPHIGHO2_01_FULL_39_10]